ncbi:deoxycytidylate deaminase-like isoform X2 [Sinocyclocheilus anshuiensis]|uniref:deoxycytidylate deaminase-like isoform X2 n=1 Tax=Sinocyclocheilus anshuiensis TaxID=1608454 RepID=UPI0007B8CEEE|nr:PREDICTED: deoxycytidylate deaminase-like isoform X2 [Sinocyclocheilus anshuiensis]
MDDKTKNDTSQLNRSHSEGETKKRQGYLEWPEYFMAVAFLSAQRSKDPSSQVGACIVNQENKIVGIGYNGMPNGCDDDLLPWSRSADNKLDTKYPYGIKDVIYLSDKYHDTPEMTASRRLLNLAGITYKQFKPKQGRIVIDFNSINYPGLKTSSGLGGIQSSQTEEFGA